MIHSKTRGAQGSADGGQFPQTGAAWIHAAHRHPLHVDIQHRHHSHDDPHPGGRPCRARQPAQG